MDRQDDALLIIDNDLETIESLSEALVHKGYCVSSTLDEKEGVRKCAQEKPEFVLLDLSHSSGKGVSLISRMLSVHPLANILTTTWQDHTQDALDWIRAGACDYLKKPLKIQVLLRALERTRTRAHQLFLSDSLKESCIVKEHKTLIFGNDPERVSSVINEAVCDTRLICRDIDMLRMALSEIVFNAIEHGNLNISAGEKNHAVERGDYLQLIEKRRKDPRYRDRKVMMKVLIDRASGILVFHVIDEGTGFNYRALTEVPPGGNMGSGLGIELARNFFKEVRYSGRGNRVKLVYCENGYS
ncbi:MAG TPA: response regulator [Deltaproteobacteria bacterium]|nr:response regulator [Deltaproteobacteria bacterium]